MKPINTQPRDKIIYVHQRHHLKLSGSLPIIYAYYYVLQNTYVAKVTIWPNYSNYKSVRTHRELKKKKKIYTEEQTFSIHLFFFLPVFRRP